MTSRAAPELPAEGAVGAPAPSAAFAEPRAPDAPALPHAAVVFVESDAGDAVPAVVHHLEGERLRLEILGATLAVPLHPGVAVTIDGHVDAAPLRLRAVVETAAAFPTLDLRLTGVAPAAGAPAAQQIAIAFPVRYQVLPRSAAAIAARMRACLAIVGEAVRAAEPAEVALLALGKMMARLDARFDRVIARDLPGRRHARSGDVGADDPHEVLVFSLAKMMMTRLDEKFDRLLAAMRDPAVPGRAALDDDQSHSAIGFAPHHVQALHALTRLMESLSEKFERVVTTIATPDDTLRLADAWGLAAGEAGVVLGLAVPPPAGALLDLELRLPVFPPLPICAFGRVDVVSEHPDDVPDRKVRARVTFVALPEIDRELLVQLVLRKQREQLRARHARALGD